MSNLSKKYAAYQQAEGVQELKAKVILQNALESSTADDDDEYASDYHDSYTLDSDSYDDAFTDKLDVQEDDFNHFDDYGDYDSNYEDSYEDSYEDNYETTYLLDDENRVSIVSTSHTHYSEQEQLNAYAPVNTAATSINSGVNSVDEQENIKINSSQKNLNQNTSEEDENLLNTTNSTPAITPWEKLEVGEKAWDDFTQGEREQIVRHYSPKIRFIASRMKAKLPKHIELTELISAGTIGLLEALGKFKPQFAIRFDSYAESRIRGAMIDELRRLDWFSRSLRARVREINQVIWRIESEQGRTPTATEISELTGINEKDVNSALEALQNHLCVSLEVIQDCVASDGGTNNEEDPYKNTAFLELVEKISSIIDTLTPREKLVLSLYYNDELNMREASEVMEITEGRVSQLHTQAITRLRRIFAEQFEDSL